MADTTDMILPPLREMRAENLKLHGETRAALEEVEVRIAAFEKAPENFRHALSADSLLSKLVTGEFEGRIELSERNVAELQTITGAKR